MSIYRIMYAGEWRPVVNLLRGKEHVSYAEQATAVVIKIDGGFMALPVTPGDVFTEWYPYTPDESRWQSY